jgi:hypothetical protein
MDTVIHETSHMLMVNANGRWYKDCPIHYMFTPPSSEYCAWTEGWADFFPLAVHNDSIMGDYPDADPCYNNLWKPCYGYFFHVLTSSKKMIAILVMYGGRNETVL